MNSAQMQSALSSFSVCWRFIIKCGRAAKSHIKTDKKNRRAITKQVLLRNIVLQRCSFFVLLTEKIKINALHIIFYTIFELRPPPPPVNYYHVYLLWCKML